MKVFIALLKKEFLESFRSGKLFILGMLFLLFGIMNPAIAKLTPWLFEVLADSLENSGMSVTTVTIDAFASWQQFFKNIPMALIVFVLLYGSIFTKEYDKGTLILLLTKGVDRYKVVLAKAVLLLILWTIGYYLCFIVTYMYNDYFWDNSIINNLTISIINWWLFGIFVLSLLVFFSTCFKEYSLVLLSICSVTLFFYVISFLKKIKYFLPTTLMETNNLLAGIDSSIFIKTIIITILVSIGLLITSIPIMNKKEI